MNLDEMWDWYVRNRRAVDDMTAQWRAAKRLPVQPDEDEEPNVVGGNPPGPRFDPVQRAWVSQHNVTPSLPRRTRG